MDNNINLPNPQKKLSFFADDVLKSSEKTNEAFSLRKITEEFDRFFSFSSALSILLAIASFIVGKEDMIIFGDFKTSFFLSDDKFTFYLLASGIFFSLTNKAKEYYVLVFECIKETEQVSFPGALQSLLLSIFIITVLLIASFLIYMLGAIYIPLLRSVFL